MDASATTRGGMLLVAGYPGTGKSVLAAAVERRIPGLRAIAFDDAKLARYERAGFADPQERARLDALALDDFLADVDAAMAEGATIAIDYPFSEKQRPQLAALCERHAYVPCTVRLVAEFDVLFDRQRARDLDPSRHPALILDAYVPGAAVDAAMREAAALTRTEFRRRYDERGYGDFALGDTIEIDTTDFTTVDVEAIADWVEARLRAATPADAGRGRA